jgi:hypothetical protein
MEGVGVVMERWSLKQQPTPWEGEKRPHGEVAQAMQRYTLVRQDPDHAKEGK